MIIECLTMGAFQENTWLVGDEEGGEAFVVDPGAGKEHVLAAAAKLGLTIRAVINTHGHYDHIENAAALVGELDLPFRLHPDDAFLLDHVDEVAAMFGLPTIEVPPLGPPLSDGEKIRVGKMEIEVIHTPGHSPGGVCLLVGGHLFVGDTLFAGSIGRTDLPGGDMATLMTSIFTRLIEALPPGTIAHTGHGPDTTLAEEAGSNPFLLNWRG